MSSKLGSNALAKKWRGGFGLGCLSGIVLAMIAVVVLSGVVRGNPGDFPGPVRSLFGADGTIVTTGEGGSSLSLDQIRAIRGVQPTIQVTLTEEDINTYLEENPEAVGLPKDFTKPRVRFTEGRVRLLVSTKVFLFSTRIAIDMEPSVETGELKLRVKKIKAGDVELPGELRQIAEKKVADLLADRLGEAGLRPASVAVGDGTLTVSARLVPVDAPLVPPESEPDEEGAGESGGDQAAGDEAADGDDSGDGAAASDDEDTDAEPHPAVPDRPQWP